MSAPNKIIKPGKESMQFDSISKQLDNIVQLRKEDTCEIRVNGKEPA